MSEAIIIDTIFDNLREFPTPVILDQARERAALRGKICDRFSEVNCVHPYPIVSRSGGHGSIEEREILNLSPSAEGFGAISGRAFLHGERAQKQT